LYASWAMEHSLRFGVGRLGVLQSYAYDEDNCGLRAESAGVKHIARPS
jgi:hypothetical protein